MHDSRIARRASLGDLASRLAEARDVEAAGERLVEHLGQLIEGAAARVYLLGPGDQCGTCPRARECSTRDRCFHLAAGSGSFAQPPGHVERIPRAGTVWAEAAASHGPTRARTVPAELLAPGTAGDATTTLLLPVRAGGEAVGVVGVRLPENAPAALEEPAMEAEGPLMISMRSKLAMSVSMRGMKKRLR